MKKTNCTFIHLIDHDRSIFKLIAPLQKFEDHKIITSFSKNIIDIEGINSMLSRKGLVIIIHMTGGHKPFYDLKEYLLQQYQNIFFFLHVSPTFFKLKGKEDELSILIKLAIQYEITILTPSRELEKEFSKLGVKSKFVQIGTDHLLATYPTRKSGHFITTVCSSGTIEYETIKGIDIFSKLMRESSYEDKALIFGQNMRDLGNIKTMFLSENKFISMLKKSRIFMQLSRTEAYNVSAIYAKRLKIPVIVSDIEGHIDNVKYGFRVKDETDAKKYLDLIFEYPDSKMLNEIIDMNFADSIERETLSNFHLSFNQILEK